MNIIIPMAGMGKRMRPHTLTIPKPLIPIAGKPIVQRLVEDIAKVCPEKIDEIGFIIGDFGPEVEEKLLKTAEKVGAKGRIFYQTEALGTAHAIQCAADLLTGPVIVAFADTLFSANFKMDTSPDGMIWVQKVEDPSAFGVVLVNDQNVITDLVEKPQTFVSDLAIIGIYYVKDGQWLKNEIDDLITNDLKEKGEYQLTNALENMKKKGAQFVTGAVDEWLDCGNKDATVYTNQRILELVKKTENLVSQKAILENSVVIEPCYIGPDVILRNAVVGPHVSIGHGTIIENCVVSNTIIQEKSHLARVVVANSMVGNFSHCHGQALDLSLGDYVVIR
jgi:glucose-1-phosphate thymidylyltransferase